MFTRRQSVRLITEEWKEFYDEKHPHESLRDKSTREYLKAVNSTKLATNNAQREFTTIDSHSSSSSRNRNLSLRNPVLIGVAT